MLRLLGLLPPVEPTEQELAEARILEQTGYTSETIEGFKEQIRDRDRQLVQLEEELTRRILLLQKERDEAMLGRGVGLSPRAPLQPAGVDDAAALADTAALDGQQAQGGLDEAQAQQYEQHIEQLHAHIQQLEQQLQQMQMEEQQQAHEPPQHDHDPHGEHSSHDDGEQQPQPSDSDPTHHDLLQRVAAAEAEAAHWRSAAERATHEKEQMERHLTGVLASPAVTAATSPPPMQFPAQADAINGSEQREEIAGLRAQLDEASRLAEEQRAALEAEQQRAAEAHAQVQQLREQLQAVQEQLQQSSDQQAATTAHTHELQGQLDQSQARAADLDGEVRRLQSELLRLQSVDQQPPSVAAAPSAPTDSAELSSLRAQVSHLQSQLAQQLAAFGEERKRTQSTLHEKLAQVKVVMQRKDETIAKLRAEISISMSVQTQPQPHSQLPASQIAPHAHAQHQSPEQLAPHGQHCSPQQQAQLHQPVFHSPQHFSPQQQQQQQTQQQSPLHFSPSGAQQPQPQPDNAATTPPNQHA